MKNSVGPEIVDSSYAVATTATIWALVVRPFSRKARDARIQSKYERAWFRGTPLVVGMTERIPSAPERMASLEAGLTRVESKQTVMDGKLDELHAMIKTLMPNGKDTNNTGDLNYRMAEKLGVIVEDSE